MNSTTRPSGWSAGRGSIERLDIRDDAANSRVPLRDVARRALPYDAAHLAVIAWQRFLAGEDVLKYPADGVDLVADVVVLEVGQLWVEDRSSHLGLGASEVRLGFFDQPKIGELDQDRRAPEDFQEDVLQAEVAVEQSLAVDVMHGIQKLEGIRLRVASASLSFRLPMYFRRVSSQNSIMYSSRVSSYR